MFKVKKYILLYGIATLYMLGAFAFGEFHPFSSFPMYNQLPNWSYVFYFTDEQDQLIPGKNLNITGGQLGHLYYNIASAQNIETGNGLENDSSLNLIGQIMLEEVMKYNPNFIVRIKLKRKYFYLSNDKINVKENLMYENKLE